MKLLKIAALIAGVVVVLAAILIGVALMPAVQTWAARKAVAGQPGAKIEIGRVSAGPGSTEISDLRVTQDGVVISARQVTTRYSLWDYIAHRRLSVGEITAQGFVVDLRHPTGATTTATASAPPAASQTTQPSGAATSPPGLIEKTATKRPAFNGMLGNVQLPVDVHLAKLAVDGQVLLPNERVVAFELHGSEIAPGQDRGHLEWKVDFTDPAKTSAVRAARLTGSLALHITADRHIDAIEIETDASAEGPKIPADRVKLQMKAAQPVVGGDEHYNAAIALVRAEKIEPVLNAQIDYQANSHQLAGTWNIGVRSEQAAALLAGFGLPEATVNGAGKFTLQPDSNTLATTGEITAQLAGLEKISRALTPLGGVELHAAFDAGIANHVARLDRLDLATAAGDGRKLVEITTRQKISFDLATKHVALETPGAELAHVSIKNFPLAWAQSFAKPLTIDNGDLSLVLAVEADADGSHVRVRALEPVVLRDVTVHDGERKLIDQLTVSLNPAIEYADGVISADLDNIAVSTNSGDSVAGKISAQITQLATAPAIAFTVQIKATAAGALKPYLPIDIGPLTFVKNVEGKFEGQTLQLDKASVIVSRSDGAFLASFETLQPVTANFQTLAIAAAQPDAAALRIRLGEVPLAWAEAFVPKSKFAGTLGGAALDVSVASKDDFRLTTTEPLVVRGAGAAIDSRELANGLDLAVDFSASKHAGAITYDVRDLEVQQAAVSLVKLHATGGLTPGTKLAASAKGELAIDLAALLRQPALASPTALARGELKASFDATLGDSVSAKAAVTIRNLTARQGNQALGDVDVNVDVATQPDGSGSVNLPLTLTVGGRRSDLTVAGSFAKTASGISFNGKLNSEQIIADDFQGLTALAPSSSSTPAVKATATPQPPPTAAAPIRDTAPFWKGITGQFEVDLKKIQYGRDYPITGIHGTATVTDARLACDSLVGQFKGAPFQVTAAVTFDDQRSQPYALSSKATISDFDLGEFLRAGNPSEPPAVETKLSADATMTGGGVNAADLGQNTYGQFDVRGTKGVLRALAKNTGMVAGLGAKALSFFGAVKKSDSLVALGELTAQLQVMPFDSFTMHVERTADFNLKLTSLEFLSPAARLTGTGSIDYRKNVAFGQLPLHLNAQLSGKEHMAVLLGRVQMLSGKQDEKGYSLMSSPFVIGGTVAKPDSTQLWKILGQVGLGAFLH